MKKLLLSILAILFLSITTIHAQNWSQLGLDIDGEAAGDESGHSVSLSADGQTVAIGARFNDGVGTDAGHVRVYKLISGVWTQQGADIDAEAANDRAGFSTSLSDDGLTVAVGAYSNDGNGLNSGHVRVYKFISNAWVQQGQDIDGENPGDYSGQDVNISGDGSTVAIGAPLNDDNGFQSGHTRVFKFISNTWVQQGQDIDGEALDDRSGYSVSLSTDGLTVAIGAVRNDGNGSNSGHVRVYKLISNVWTQQGTDIDGELASDNSGISVSISGDGLSVAIGAPGNDGINGANSGHARVYRLISNVWTQQGQDIDGEDQSDASGFSVSLSTDGQTIACGARFNDGNGSSSGHVRVYKLISNVWTQQGSDIDGEASGDWCGHSVSLSNDGSVVAIGAIKNAGNGTDAGHVRVYEICATTTSSFSDTACDSYTVPSGDETYTSSQTVMDTIPNIAGCDSIMTINITINNSNSSAYSVTACDSYTVPSGDETYTTSQTVMDTIPNTAGCDSIMTITLNINNSTNSSFSVSACNSYTVPSGDETYTTSQTVMDTIPNNVNCDSVMTITININNSTTSAFSVTACDSYTVPSGDETYTSSQTVMDTIPNNVNCDSVMTITITIDSSTTSSFSVSACDSYTVPSGDETYTTSQTVMDTIPNNIGCDSIMTITVTINTVDVSVTNTSPTLMANATGAAYQWLDCDDSYAILTGETNQSFTATTNGNFAVEVTENNCIDTSACESVTGVGIVDNSFGNSLTVFPNPTAGNFSIDLGDVQEQVTVTLTTLTGKLLLSKQYYKQQILELEVAEPTGIYLLSIESAQKKAVVKLVKR